MDQLKIHVDRERYNPHLMFDVMTLSFCSLSVDQLFYRSGQTWRLARGQQIMCASCHFVYSQCRQLADEGVYIVTSSGLFRISEGNRGILAA